MNQRISLSNLVVLLNLSTPISDAISCNSSSFNLSLLLKYNLSILGNSLTIISYLLSINLTLTSENKLESFKVFIISLVYSLSVLLGIWSKRERITS